ncbi:DUF2254 domain-containing protein [Nocardioides sp. SYSU DS0663]|uniref:DUF2254 domain-containing protein n=1 Tax=Nocardioides sp. SYSU DS0663 TaxID=3416445 RepID=UPI003F4BCC82
MAGTGVRDVGLARRVVRTVFGPFWVIPTLWCAGAVVAALLLPAVENGTASWMPLLFGGGAEGARAVLSAIAGAMISVTGLVFSITIVVLQLASSQFSPRVLGTFLDDRITQHTLGVFAASFLYSLTVLRSIVDEVGREVPQLAVTGAYLLVLAAVGMFLAFIHHITESIRVGTIVRRTSHDTRRLLEKTLAQRPATPGEPELTELAGQHVVTAARSGYLDAVQVAPLVSAARDRGVRVELLHRLGTFLPEGSPLAVVHGARTGGGADGGDLVHRHVQLTAERSLQQDVSYGVRRLVDIAERALSPGVNDPTTAAQVIDQLHDLLRRLAVHRDPTGVEADADGVARVVLRPHSFADLLDHAVDEVAHWGADSLQVPRRLQAMLADLGAAARPEHRPALEAKRADVDRVSGRGG